MKRIKLINLILFMVLLCSCSSVSGDKSTGSFVKYPDDYVKNKIIMKNYTDNSDNFSYSAYYASPDTEPYLISDSISQYPLYSETMHMWRWIDNEGNYYIQKDGKEREKIASNVYRGLTYCTNTLALLKYEADNSGISLYIKRLDSNEEAVKIAKNIGEDYDIEFSNDGKYVYYLDSDSNLYYIDTSKGDNMEKVKVSSDVLSYEISPTGESVLYCKNSLNTYIKWSLEEDSEKITIDEGIIYGPVYTGTGRALVKTMDSIFDVDSFDLYFIEKGVGYVKIASGVKDFSYTPDITHVAYINEENRGYFVELPKKNDKNIERLKERISSINHVKLGDDIKYVSARYGGGNVCWLNGDDELCYMNTKGKEEKIASGVNSFSFNRYSITMKCEDRTGYMFLKKNSMSGAELVWLEDVEKLKTSEEGKYIVYIEDDKVYVASPDGVEEIGINIKNYNEILYGESIIYQNASQTIESQTTPDATSQYDLQTNDSLDYNNEVESGYSDVAMYKAVDFLGRPIEDAINQFGSDYQITYYEGSYCVYYEDQSIPFAFLYEGTKDYILGDEPISYVLVKNNGVISDEYYFFTNNMTYTDILTECEVSTENYGWYGASCQGEPTRSDIPDSEYSEYSTCVLLDNSVIIEYFWDTPDYYNTEASRSWVYAQRHY